MNYIYDIYLNLNNILFDFFDWNKNDKIIHVRKIPIFKVNEELLKKIINNSIKVNTDFLKKIYNKTELWNEKGKIEFCSLFCDYNNIVAIELNEEGISIKKSFLLIDEELEILETVRKLKEIEIEFEIVKKDKPLIKTRKQIKDENFINSELKNIEINKLSYIYYECFGKYENNKKIIINNIKNLPKNSKTYKNLYDILKLTSTTKNKML